MLINPQFDGFLVRIVKAVRPYLDQLVLIGGCASALYRYHDASSRGLRPMVTKDIDIAGKDRLAVASGAKPLAELLTEGGLKEERASEGNPPVVKYVQEEGATVHDLEFLCPLRQKRRGRKAAPGSAVEIQDGLMAQPLQYLDLLLINTWQVDLARIKLPGLCENPFWVRVPNPASYVVQKVLIRDRPRDVDAKRKDCYYIYELSVTFREAIDRLAKEFEALKQQVQPKWIQRFRRVLVEVFESPSADGPMSVVAVHRASPDHVQEAREMGFIVNADSVCRSVQKLFPAFGL